MEDNAIYAPNFKEKKRGILQHKEGWRRGEEDHVIHTDLSQDQVEKLGAQIVELKVIIRTHADKGYIFKIFVILV